MSHSGLYVIKWRHVEMLPMRDEQTTSEDRATQLLICDTLSLATGARVDLYVVRVVRSHAAVHR